MNTPEKLIRIAFFFILIGSLTACSGTKEVGFDGKGNDAVALFPASSNVTWGGLYLGLKDGAHPVSLALASDGAIYKGILKYQTSGEKYTLEGPLNIDPKRLPDLINPEEILGTLETIGSDGTLTLESFNGDIYVSPSHPAHLVLHEYFEGNLAGNMTCVFTVGDILMYYSAEKARVGAHFEFKKVKSFDEKNPLAGKNWIKSYEGLPGKSDTKARTIFAKAGHLTSLTIYDKENDLRLSNNFDLRLDEKNRVIITSLVDLNDNQLGTTNCSFTHDWTNMTMEYQLFGSPSKTLNFQESMTLSTKSLTHINYYSWADMDVPQAEGDKLFNQLMDDLASEWMAKHNTYVDSVKKTGIDLNRPEHRFEFRSYIWHTVSYLSEDMVSVTLTRNSTHMPIDVVNVNYNFKTHQVFNRKDVFREGSNYQEFIDDFIERAILDKPFAADPTFQKMMEGNPFRHMGVTDNGLMFSTDFNGLFGAIQVLIPFDRIRPFLNADGPLKFVLKLIQFKP